MRQLICWTVLTAIPSMGLLAQKLETQPPDMKKVIRVETAADHLTVIELGDTVTMVAVGNQGAFTVERRENKVFVKPVEEGAKTNLFVWTTGGRFAYELVPAPSVEQMHFAIDQAPTPVAAKVRPLSENDPARNSSALPAEMLTKASPILLAGERDTTGRVEIALRDLYWERNRLYVRYAIINHSPQDYLPTRPAAWRLARVRSSQSLVPFDGFQLGDRIVRSLKAADTSRLDVADASEIAPVAAGGHALGWLAVSAPEASANDSSVLRLEFAADAKGTVEALMVLPTIPDRQEVASARAAVK
ncbi:MAG: TrbG/VirB9 family P-type conjugative transfer protein [Bryobacteraceae bacterium]